MPPRSRRTCIQPTHLDSRTLNITPDDPRFADIWRVRVEGLKRILDQLGLIESSVPGLPGRLDLTRIAAAGHSWGGQTASMLPGTRVLDSDGKPGEDMSDPRVTAGVLSTTGEGGAEHSLGGIPGYTVTETTDESPERVALIQRFTWAYHRHGDSGAAAHLADQVIVGEAVLHPPRRGLVGVNRIRQDSRRLLR
jgi:hypothetical protein